ITASRYSEHIAAIRKREKQTELPFHPGRLIVAPWLKDQRCDDNDQKSRTAQGGLDVLRPEVFGGAFEGGVQVRLDRLAAGFECWWKSIALEARAQPAGDSSPIEAAVADERVEIELVWRFHGLRRLFNSRIFWLRHAAMWFPQLTS